MYDFLNIFPERDQTNLQNYTGHIQIDDTGHIQIDDILNNIES